MAEDDVTWTPVFSSWVAEIGYDSENNRMLVKWAKGGMSAYDGVPEEIADQVAKSWSVGDALKTMIIGQYDHSKVG